MNPTLKTDKYGNIISNTSGQNYSFTPTGDINYAQSGSNYVAPPTKSQVTTSTPVVGSVQYDIANGLALGTSSSSTYKQPTTISDAYGTGDATYDSIVAGYKKQADSPDVTAESLMADKMKLYQAEIDAVNKIYTDKIQTAKVAGQGRLGSSRASQARSGLLGSDFGASQTANVETQNQEIEDAYRNENTVQIQAIMGKARGDAVAEAEAKRVAKEQGAKSYIEFLTGAEARKKARITDLAKSLIAQGKDIKSLTDADLATLATSYGTTKDNILATFNTEKIANDKALAEIEKSGLGTGAIGEYQFYVKQEELAGRKPVGFNEYQNMDANRKASIARAGVSNGQFGLSSGQTGNLLSITNKFQADPIMKAANQGATAIDVADRVIADPNNAGGQLSILYTLVKSLDPDSAVREGEVGLAQTTQSFLGKFGTNLQRIYEGKPISASAAKTLAEETKKLANAWYTAGQTRENQYKSQAQTVGLGDPFNAYLGGYQRPYTQTGGTAPTAGQTSSGIKYTITQ